MKVHHKLTKQDKHQRVAFLFWMGEEKTAADPDLEGIWFSDEAHFHLTGQVNSQYCQIWASELPDAVGNWNAITQPETDCVVRDELYWKHWAFLKTGTAAFRLSIKNVMGVLDRFWIAVQQHVRSPRNKIWFQLDGGTPHTSNLAPQWLEERLGGKIISRATHTPWPAHGLP